MSVAVHAITKNGLVIARKLAEAMPEIQVFVSEQFVTQGTETAFSFPLSSHFDKEFDRYRHHICLFSVGIAARIIAPRLVDKRKDPAVVCVDEQGHHAVAFAGGHRGGANEMSRRVAYLLGGTAVVTTASDTTETLSVDMLGAHLGWALDPSCEEAITQVSAAVVNGNPVVICQQTGERDWWQHDKKLPQHLQLTQDLSQLQDTQAVAAVVITDTTNFLAENMANRTMPLVVWRPRSLVIGIGCDRNTPQAVIERGLACFMTEHNLAYQSIASLVSIDLKADEVGIIEAAAKLNRPFITFTAEILKGVEGVENPSAVVERCIGVTSVAEAACLHAAERTKLLVPKHKYKFSGFNMTLAVCRRDFPQPVSRHRHGELHSNSATRTCPNRPIKHYLYQLIVCEGGRCEIPGQAGLAHRIRGLLKESGFSKGVNRIKVTRSHCLGCCRKLVPMVIYQGKSQTRISENHALWLQKVDRLTDEQWQQVFHSLVEDSSVKACLRAQYISDVESAL
ncbi:cobalamin biosynthesis protein [Shewanella benthica]|uniref:Precorrin methylase n=1 Tax=Shewanella benthica KT99 TaxID=314608 RepID=A9D3E3_9GAMM|nr:cobalamin biosynthesis protein [Shewanella benthica]EDQ01672.1 precorrin methylase [Shewanella benthica KT99]